jgi:hypothetical protein
MEVENILFCISDSMNDEYLYISSTASLKLGEAMGVVVE